MITKEKMQFMWMPDGVVTSAVAEEPPTNRGMEAVNEPPAKTGNEPVVPKEGEPLVEPTPPTAVVDAAALAKSFGDVLSERFKPEPTKEKTVDDLSPEEAEKLLNVWKPTKEWIAKFGNLETQEEALKELRDGMVKHTDTISQYRLRELKKSFDETYAPVLSYIEERKERETKDRFDKAYPQLSDPALEGLLKTVTGELQKKGKKYDDEKTLFQDVASGVEAVIKVTNPDFKLTAGSSPATTKTKGQSPNSIPVTTPGAGGGSAVKTKTSEGKPRGLAIFD